MKNQKRLTPQVSPRQYRERVAYVNPDTWSRDAWGYVIGEPMLLPGAVTLGRNAPRAVAVLWFDGMVTVEDRRDLWDMDEPGGWAKQYAARGNTVRAMMPPSGRSLSDPQTAYGDNPERR